MKRVNFTSLGCLLLVLVIFVNEIKAQVVQLNSGLTAAGGSSVSPHYIHDFSVGDMVLSETFSQLPGLVLTQGFLQPFFSTTLMNNLGNLAYGNVITPNGDGKNDYLKIIGLDKFPKHTISIVNRWGAQVYFNDKGYKDDWNGTGLSDGTYYFFIKYEDPSNGQTYNQNGFIMLIRGKR